MSTLSSEPSTLSQETMLELMQYADGELDGDAAARARVEELLRTSDEARRVVAALGTLGDIVREEADERSGMADAIADRVMAGITSADPAAKVIPLVRPARRGRSGAVPAVVAGLALAAGVVLFIRSQGAPSSSHEGRFAAAAPPSVESQGDDDDTSDGALAQTELPGVDLEEVRSIRNKVDVFFVPSEKSAGASVVVWIDDRGDRRGEH
jgi:hypothetical protein